MDIYEKAEKSQKKAQEGLEDKENNTIQSSLLETENFIVEQVLGMNNEHSERSVSNIQTDYVKYYKTNPEKIERVDRVGHNGKVFIPIQGKMVTEKIDLKMRHINYQIVSTKVDQRIRVFGGWIF